MTVLTRGCVNPTLTLRSSYSWPRCARLGVAGGCVYSTLWASRGIKTRSVGRRRLVPVHGHYSRRPHDWCFSALALMADDTGAYSKCRYSRRETRATGPETPFLLDLMTRSMATRHHVIWRHARMSRGRGEDSRKNKVRLKGSARVPRRWESSKTGDAVCPDKPRARYHYYFF